MGRAIAVVIAVLVIPHTTTAQTSKPADSKMSFEVATVKRNTSGSQDGSVRLQPGGRVTITNNTLFNIIRNAYNVQSYQIVGGSDWINSDRWDVVAKAEGNAAGPDLLRMMQELVTDRFKAVIRRDTRQLPVYALVPARRDRRLGPHLTASSVDCNALMAAAVRGGTRPPPQPSGRPTCGIRVTMNQMLAGGVLIADIARNLSEATDRIIVDRTGLSGAFDVELTWTPDRLPSRAPGTPADQPVRINGIDIDPDGPSLFTALEEQLGLKLESSRGPVDVLVIDHVERATED